MLVSAVILLKDKKRHKTKKNPWSQYWSQLKCFFFLVYFIAIKTKEKDKKNKYKIY